MNFLKALMLTGLLGLVAACNTVSGMGEDLQSGGEAVSDTADDAQQSM